MEQRLCGAHRCPSRHNPAIKQVHLSVGHRVTMNGLPMAAQDYDNVFVVRAEQKGFQQWKQHVPWAKAGDATVANGGDVGKEVGLYPEIPCQPVMASFVAVVASAPTAQPPAPRTCCKICTTGKAYGDSCINVNYTCTKPPGCACNG